MNFENFDHLIIIRLRDISIYILTVQMGTVKCTATTPSF